MSPKVRDIIAAVVSVVFVLTFAGIVIVQTLRNQPVNVPEVILSPVLLVVGFFFGAHANANGAYAAGQAASEAVNQLKTAVTIDPSKPNS